MFNGYFCTGCNRTFGDNCSNHCPFNCLYGQCHLLTGQCYSCVPGYQGQDCNQECENGKYGFNCENNCGHCQQNTQCHNVNGWCLQGCFPGYIGPSCNLSPNTALNLSNIYQNIQIDDSATARGNDKKADDDIDVDIDEKIHNENPYGDVYHNGKIIPYVDVGNLGNEIIEKSKNENDGFKQEYAEQYRTIFLTLHEMFKAPAVALNATGFLKKLATKKEQSLGKEFQSFTKENACIITHYPAPENAVDFLRLITDYDCELVVSMEPLQEVESKGNETWSVNITEPSSRLTVDSHQTVSQILALVSFSQNIKTKNPIIVVSRDGAALCGVFCAVYNLIQQLTMDEEIDVFSVVRLLQTRRPELCLTLDLYNGGIQEFTNRLEVLIDIDGHQFKIC
uniref:Multiple epidermal growth factor-like domains 6 n=1 Tax=Magallana gigas TaxID=29159 RepID=K1Q410_MAGGI